MINDLPSNTEAFDELNVSCLDPVLKDYVFSSFFLARLVEKTVREKNELEKENILLRAQIEEYAQLKAKFNELKAYLDNLGNLTGADAVPPANAGEDVTVFANSPEFQDECFIKRNRDNMEKVAEGEIPEAVAAPSPVVEAAAEPVAEVAAEPAADAVAEMSVEDIAASLGDLVLDEPVVAEPAAEVAAEPVAEVAAEPIVEAAAEPVADAVAEMSVEDITASLGDLVLDEPVAEPVAEVAAELAADAVAEMSVEDITASLGDLVLDEPVAAEPVVEAAEPAAEVATEPAADAVAEMSVEDIAASLGDLVLDEPVAAEPVAEVTTEPVVEAAAAPEPAPAPAPAVEMPTDPNAALTPEQIAALFAGV